MGSAFHPTRFWLLCAALLLALACPSAPVNAAATAEAAGRVILATGETSAELNGAVRPLWRRAAVYSGDILRTGPASSLQVRFNDGGLITLAPDTTFAVRTFSQDPQNPDLGKAFWELMKGGFRAISGSIGKNRPEDYKVTTEAATIGIRGTHYGAWLDEDGELLVQVVEGGVKVANDHGSIALGQDAPFSVARATADSAPVGLTVLPPGVDTGLSVATPAWQPQLPGGGSTSGDSFAPLPTSAADVPPPAPGTAGLVANADINSNASANSFLTNSLLPSVQPSATEQVSLANTGTRGLVTGLGNSAGLAAAVQTGPGTLADDGTPLFLLADGTSLLRQSGAVSNQTVNGVGGFDVSWGVFDPVAGSGGTALLVSNSGGGQVDQVSRQVLWLLAAETDLSVLSINRRYGADVAFLGQGSAGAISQLGFFFDSRINLGNGLIEEGLLLVDVADGTEEYRVNFIGNVLAGAVDLQVVDGAITLADRSVLPVDLDLSALVGLFTGDQADAFVGQFYVQEADNAERFVQGVLLGTPLD